MFTTSWENKSFQKLETKPRSPKKIYKYFKYGSKFDFKVLVMMKKKHPITLERIYNPITAMGFSAMFTFHLDNTKR